MHSLTDVFSNNVFNGTEDFKLGKPLPMAVIDNFLPAKVALELFEESNSIPSDYWTKFTRNGSHMKESKHLSVAPHAFNLVSYLHSSYALKSLEEVTGIRGIIPDPHLIGAGYSKSGNGDTLQIHNDFNWNEELQLHRALSLILYISPDWQTSWGGALDFYDDKRENIIRSVDCIFNRCLIWEYNKFGFHGYETPISCPPNEFRTTFRVFYYTSNSTHKTDDPPHRSQYWFDPTTGKPYDIRDHK
jgi:hypothetical protein